MEEETWTSRTPDREGQGLAEYALILALIAIVTIVALRLARRPDQQGVSRTSELHPQRRPVLSGR